MKQKANTTAYNLAIVIEKDKDGYFAYCPELQGCYSQGATHEEAEKNIRDAIKLHIEDRKASAEELPDIESVSISSIRVFA